MMSKLFNKKQILIIILTFVTLIQIITYCYLETTKNVLETVEVLNTNIYSYNDIINELERIENLAVEEIENDYTTWNIVANIKGSKSVIVETLENLSDYKVKSYDISVNDGILQLKLAIIR